MPVDPLTHEALKLALFVVLIAFVAYVLSHAFGTALKKAQSVQYKKAEEYQYKISRETEIVKDKSYLKNIGFDYKFGLLPGQSEVVDGITVTYAQYDAKTHIAYINFECPDGKSQVFKIFYTGSTSAENVGYYCQFGGTATTLVGTVEISPAISVIKSDKGEVETSVPYLTFYLRVIEKPVSGTYIVLDKKLKPGQSASVKLNDYTITVSYYYIGYYSDTLIISANVTSKDGNSWSTTLANLYTGVVRGFSSNFDISVARVIYLPGGEEVIFTGEVQGIKPDTVALSLTIGIATQS